VATSQLAIPQDACNQAYGADGYARSVTNLAPLALESDMVFADGTALQLATATGSADDGFAPRLSMVVQGMSPSPTGVTAGGVRP
jgi:hypothetical protein